ncbi:ATP-binding protein [Candidatus Gottesmanbacteria bacterium]|nr:ATP-binding protein [Candidatus Gottesmanbacteria bacterium]
MQQSTIPITFDKSHLTTIGTRLYAESLDLVRELVANAYDADASEVKIHLTENELVVEDDGQGMDRQGLTQYFTIGSDFKKLHPTSFIYHRQRIGEFGIGKFAVLSLCNRFSIYTKKEGYSATVMFDKEQFESNNQWEIPIFEQPSSSGGSGTKVTLHDLRYPIGIEQLERRLRQQLPLSQKDFRVFLNGSRITAHVVPGRRYKIREFTPHGAIAGEIIISSLLLPSEQVGIAVKVKGMTIRREMFGLESLHQLPARRLTGEINVDFLPLTSARDNFLKETPEYGVFCTVMEKKVRKIARDMKASSSSRQDFKTDAALSNALSLVKHALKKNPDIFFTHDLPLFTGSTTTDAGLARALGSTTVAKRLGSSKKKANIGVTIKTVTSDIVNKHHRSMVKTVLRDKNRLIKRVKIGGMNLVCSLSHLGETEAESFVEGGIIFINRDHPLFVQTANDEALGGYHLARLITQELVKLGNPEHVAQAYDWQSRLLTDAFVVKQSA